MTYVSETEPDTDYGKGLIGAWGLVFVGVAVSSLPNPLEARLFCLTWSRLQLQYTSTKVLVSSLG